MNGLRIRIGDFEDIAVVGRVFVNVLDDLRRHAFGTEKTGQYALESA